MKTEEEIREIEKLYENAGLSNMWVERYDNGYGEHERYYNSYSEMIKSMMKSNDWTLTEAQEVAKRECRKEHPPFTAEKQLELIKWISNNDKDKNKELTLYNSAHPYYYFGLYHEPAHSEDDMWGYGEGLGTTFEDGLAKLINDLWQDLTEKERKQIKEVLE